MNGEGGLRRGNPDISRPAALVMDAGLFRGVRDPMHVGDAIRYTGFAVLALNTLSSGLLALALLALIRQSWAEGRYLAVLHPAQYREWSARTKCILPGPY